MKIDITPDQEIVLLQMKKFLKEQEGISHKGYFSYGWAGNGLYEILETINKTKLKKVVKKKANNAKKKYTIIYTNLIHLASTKYTLVKNKKVRTKDIQGLLNRPEFKGNCILVYRGWRKSIY